METEENLIPYHASDPTGKKVLVLAPHPDDETIGCGGSVIRHTEAGDPVKIIFLTNGAKGDISGKMKREAYIKWRREEAQKACDVLGVRDMEFWGYEDRSLAGSHGALRRLMDVIELFRPQLIYAPSPMEIHPDHRAASFLLSDAIRSGGQEFQVAFYEIGQPVRINRLVDITNVLEKRIEAISCYESQLKERPYQAVSVSLNRYRSITLPEPMTHAEGFFLCEAALIRKIGPLSLPFHRVHRLLPAPEEAGPLVSLIVRTKDRPRLLANALRSIAEQTYANLEIVLVNDGGVDVSDVAKAVAGDISVTHIIHEKGKGRAAAANSGLEAAKGVYLNFLDDDDVLYPDHVHTLVQCLETGETKVAYTSIVSAYFEGPPGRPDHCLRRVVDHAVDFDPERILFQNYIPMMSVMFHKDVASKLGPFDTDLDLFEDWDYWIRASRAFTFHHIDKVTAEYRFYRAETTEDAHRRKYLYDEAQERIFERIAPLLRGKTWTRLLDCDWFEELRRKREKDPGDPALEQLQTALDESNEELREANGRIGALTAELKASKSALGAIYASRGWRWLARFGKFKQRLGLGSSRAEESGS